jgi:hypothetical protein
MSTKKNQRKASPEPRLHNAADFKSIYVNFVQTAANVTDISIMAGEASPSETGVPEIEMKVRLVVAPIQAKVMLGMLLEVIRQYEEKFGKIAMPAPMAAQMAARGMTDLGNPESSMEMVRAGGPA